MALSDACFEYLTAVAEAARILGRDAHHYSDPENPLRYGPEIDALRRACIAASEAPYDPEAAARVIRLAASVMAYHDTPPTAAEASQRRADLDCLVRALQKELDSDDAAALPALVEQVSVETPFT